MALHQQLRPASVALALGAAGLVIVGSTAHGSALREVVAATVRAGFWFAVLTVAARIGALLTGSRLRGIAHLSWDGAAGLPALIVSWLVVGMAPGGFARLPILAVPIAFAVFASVKALRGRRSREKDAAVAPAGVPGAIAAALGVGIAVLGLMWDRVPPVFFDTLSYHWAQPELWIVEGRIAPVTWSLHAWFPPGMSVLYGVGLALGGERLASDANLLVGLVLLGLAWDLGRRRAGPAGGLGAAAVLAAFPITIHALGVPAADLGHGLFAAGSLGALLVRTDGDDEGWRRRAAWIASGAALTKYLGLIVPMALGAVWLGIGRDALERAAPIVARLRRAAVFVTPALLLLAPWCLANTIVTGNPLAPIGAGILPVRGLAPGALAAFQADARGGWPAGSDLGALPAQLFGAPGADSRLYPAPAWGLMPLVLLLALPLVDRGARQLDLLAMTGLVSGLWLITYRWERFLVAATFLMSVAIGALLAAAWRRGATYRLVVLLAALVGVASVVDSLVRVAAFTGGANVFAGREAARAFLERVLTPVRLIHGVSGRLDPATTRILFVGESRHYGSGIRRVAPTGFNLHPLVEALSMSQDPAAARAELRRRGFTHLMVDPGWIERSGRSYPSLSSLVTDPTRLVGLLRSLGPPIAIETGVALYEIPR